MKAYTKFPRQSKKSTDKYQKIEQMYFNCMIFENWPKRTHTAASLGQWVKGTKEQMGNSFTIIIIYESLFAIITSQNTFCYQYESWLTKKIDLKNKCI